MTDMGDSADWESRWYDSKLTVLLTPPSHGWIDMAFIGTPRGDLTEVSFSDCFDHFTGILEWVKTVGMGSLSAEFEMDEEGPWVRFLALPVAGRPDWFELQVSRSSFGEDVEEEPDTLLFRCRLERRQLVHEFWRRWDQWIREDYVARHWPTAPDRRITTDPAFKNERVLNLLRELRSLLDSSPPEKCS